MMLLALIAAAAAVPSPLKLFKDWTVGCDNGRACQAVGLIPEAIAEGGLTMTVARGAAADAATEIGFSPEASGARALTADGRRLGVRLVDTENGPRVVAADAPAVIAALRSAARLELLDGKGSAIGTVSLAGASAALLAMDDVQKRIGTVTALARPGARPSSEVPPPPPLPLVRAAPPSRSRPTTLSPARVKALRKAHGCEIEDVGGPEQIEIHPLDARRSLILLSCGSGAYNYSARVLLAETGKARIVPAPFDHRENWSESEEPTLVNASWDAARSQLSSYAKGRGIGDCGIGQDHVWDGERFRLVAQREMGECRGSLDYITTWRTRVVGR